MTPHADWVQPPRAAVWLVTLFTPAEQAESILGDLLEEFSGLASKSGLVFARRWYWRQTVKTIAHLAASGCGSAPWSTTAAVVAGFLLMRFGLALSGQAIEAVLDRYGVYQYLADLGREQPSLDVAAYVFWITRGMLIGRVLVAALVGGIVAVAAKRSEMAATMALALFMSALNVVGALANLASTGDYGFLSTLPWSFACSIAIVVGGAIVRTRRSAATARPSAI
jgi:hypothetical protein